MIRQIFKILWNKRRSNFVIMLEIALSFLVLYAVLSFTIHNIDRVSQPTGFDTEDRLLVYLDRSDHNDSTAAQSIPLLKEELENLSVIEDVATGNSVSPYSGSTWSTGNDVNGFEMQFRYTYVDEDFKETMNIPMKKGRWFEEGDDDSNYNPVIFGQAFMDKYYPDKDMIDSTIMFNGEEHRIVGISENYRYGGEFEAIEPTAFLYAPPTHPYTERVFLKMSPDAQVADEEQISKILESHMGNNGSTIINLDKLRRQSSERIWIPMIALLCICGFLCINVAMGLFGVLWFNISKRKAEIGLRKAIGASNGGIISQFVAEILLLTFIAVLFVSIFAIQIPLLGVMDIEASVFYRALLYSMLIIGIVVLICALYPSYQASRVDPAVSLHED